MKPPVERVEVEVILVHSDGEYHTVRSDEDAAPVRISCRAARIIRKSAEYCTLLMSERLAINHGLV